MNEIITLLRANSDEKQKAFSEKLIFTKYEILGVSSIKLKDIFKKVLRSEFGNPKDVLKTLSDNTYEEIALQGAIITGEKSFSVDERKRLIEKFVEKIDNWATNDSFVALSKFAKNNLDDYWEFVLGFLSKSEEFEIRYGVIMLMSYYLNDKYIDSVLEALSKVSNDAYYVKMAVAWAYATALAKYYDKAVVYLRDNRLEKWTHNKTIQKARETFRISPSQKEELKGLRRIK